MLSLWAVLAGALSSIPLHRHPAPSFQRAEALPRVGQGSSPWECSGAVRRDELLLQRSTCSLVR